MDELAFLENASAAFEDIEESGSPSAPLSFDPAHIGSAERVDAAVYNPVTHEILEVSNIIYERHADGRPPDRAYWVGRKLKKCIFGVVKACTILKFRNVPDVPWQVTEHKAAVKIMSWQKNKRTSAHRRSAKRSCSNAICVQRWKSPSYHGYARCAPRRRISSSVYAILFLWRFIWIRAASWSVS